MTEIWLRAERETASDDSLLLSHFMVEEGQTVSAGEPIAEVEGSKSVFELNAPEDGTVYLFGTPNSSVLIGQPIACICTEGEDRPDSPTAVPIITPEAARMEANAGRFSDAALAYIESVGIDPNEVLPDSTFVTASDAREFIDRKEMHLAPVRPLRIALIGGGFGATLAYEAAATSSGQQIVGVFDDHQNLLESYGVPRLGSLGEGILKSFEKNQFDGCLITIQANMTARREIALYLNEVAIPLISIIHPGANVSPLAVIGDGCLLMDNSRVGPQAVLGQNIFVSGTVNIDHHCRIGENSTFGPGVFLSGCVSVGDNCNFGTNIGVESHVHIGPECTITSGCVVGVDVPASHTVKSVSKTVVRPKAQGTAT